MSRRTLLIVEDESDLRQMYRVVLSLAGFEVTEAADGLEALRRIDGWAPPDLIILDLGMPILSGHAVAQEVAAREDLRHIPVLIVTASEEELDHLDAACVLRKPVSPDDLIRAVHRCLDSASSRAKR